MAWSLPNIPQGISAQLAYFLKWLSRPEEWTAVTFENSWSNISGYTSAFYKDPLGVVHCKGRVELGTVNTTIFTLPEGYRPTEAYVFSAMQSTNAVKLHVTTAGVVQTSSAGANTLQSVIFSFKAT